MEPEEYLRHDATDLAGLVARGDVTATELLALARRRRDEVNPTLNAVVADLGGVADARAVDPSLSGPFAGVPFLVKDLGQEYAGFPTSNGSRSLAHDVADRHALVTERFLDAGLVVFGKTNTPEFGAKGVTESDHWGPARNPWHTGHTPGGSSGGSGAAVAAGIVPAAGANDGGGSIRIPAACNGLVGLKTSRGLGPYGPQTGEVMFGMVTQGVVSRTVRDSAGAARRDHRAGPAGGLPGRRRTTSRSPTRSASGPGRCGSATRPPRRSTRTPTPRRSPRWRAAAKLLAELGHQVEEVSPPHDDEALARDFLTIWFGQLYGQVADVKQRLGSPDSHFEADTLASSAELGRAAGMLPLLRALQNVNGYIHALGGVPRDLRLLPHPDAGEAAARRSARPRRRTGCRRRRGWSAEMRAGRLLAATGDHRRADLRQHRLGALHPAREPDRPPGDQRAAALDRGRAAARGAARRPARRGRRPAAAGGPAGGGAALGAALPGPGHPGLTVVLA